jgi:glycerol-3-phosphate dehydrogenase
MMAMATWRRDDALNAMAATAYDVVVVGAGMTGAGVAVDAATRGLRVALLDAGDIASGTSSKSSKMVHGGLRYLRQREFRLVYENLRERQRLLEHAPYLVRPLPFLIPLFGRDGVVAKALVKGYSTTLRLYDLTGGWRIGQRHRRVTREEALALLPSLHAERLVAGFLYHDARGDDARVALTLARTAADHGADVANYLRAIEIRRGDDGRASAVVVRDERNGAEFPITTRSVINASGVWADDVFAMAEHQASHRVTPAKGVHLSVARERLRTDVAAVINVPGDRRSIFVVPFEESPHTFIGTTDTAYEGSLDDPVCTPQDVTYLLDAVNAATSAQLTIADVTGVWAGLRPLLAPAPGQRLTERTADLSRRHQVIDSHDGVVHVLGGKWTTYRQMAEDAVDALRPYVGRLGPTRTKDLALHASGPWRPTTPRDIHLYRRFGEDSAAIAGLIDADPALGPVAIEGLAYLRAEFVFAARDEMALTLIDLLTRRTRAHLQDARATLRAAPEVARLVAPVLGWDDATCAAEVERYRELVHHEFSAAGLPL